MGLIKRFLGKKRPGNKRTDKKRTGKKRTRKKRIRKKAQLENNADTIILTDHNFCLLQNFCLI